MDRSLQIAGLYVASLKGISIIHQQGHWTTSGELFYEQHLLLERIYNSAIEDLDLAAEKMVGLFGSDVLDYVQQADLLHKVLLNYKGISQALPRSLAVEQDFLKFSQKAYDAFENEGELTLGLDDMIMSIASNREEAAYLLKQSLSKRDTP
jgi:DNA-binding ferritin-like protein